MNVICHIFERSVNFIRRCVRTVSFVVLWLAIGVPCFGMAQVVANIPKKQAVDLVTEFVAREFNGEVDVRQSLAVFSQNTREALAKKKAPFSLEGEVVSLTGDPLIVVNEFEIGPFQVNSDRVAVVSVTFRVLASASGDGPQKRMIAMLSKHREILEYRVVAVDGKLKIQNPSKPHVSLIAVQRQYEGELKHMKTVVTLPQASNAQRSTYEALKKQAEILGTIAEWTK
jgi:hypothetical protein